MSVAFDLLLVGLVLGVAHHVTATQDVLRSVVAFIGLGLLLALAWLRLRSVDVGLTEAAIGGGATGFLLLRAEARLRGAPDPAEEASPRVRLLAAGACSGVALLLAAVVLALPDPPPSLAGAAAAQLPETGLGNPVTGVLLAFRSLDTLLETVVLFLALLGVWSLAEEGAWGDRPALRDARAPRALVLLARSLPPIGLLFGVHVFWEGATAPGGAFQAGTVLAAMGVLIVVAGLGDLPRTDRAGLRALLLAGPVLFTAIGFLGFALADGFLTFPPGFAKPPILLIEAGLTLSIAVTLAYLVAGRPEKSEGRP